MNRLNQLALALMTVLAFNGCGTANIDESESDMLAVRQDGLGSYVGRYKVQNTTSGSCLTMASTSSGYTAFTGSCATAYVFDLWQSGSTYNVCQQGSSTFCLVPSSSSQLRAANTSTFNWRQSGGVISSVTLPLVWEELPASHNVFLLSPKPGNKNQVWTFVKI